MTKSYYEKEKDAVQLYNVIYECKFIVTAYFSICQRYFQGILEKNSIDFFKKNYNYIYVPMLLKAKTTALSFFYVKYIRENKTDIEIKTCHLLKQMTNNKYIHHQGGQHRLQTKTTNYCVKSLSYQSIKCIYSLKKHIML